MYEATSCAIWFLIYILLVVIAPKWLSFKNHGTQHIWLNIMSLCNIWWLKVCNLCQVKKLWEESRSSTASQHHATDDTLNIITARSDHLSCHPEGTKMNIWHRETRFQMTKSILRMHLLSLMCERARMRHTLYFFIALYNSILNFGWSEIMVMRLLLVTRDPDASYWRWPWQDSKLFHVRYE